MNYHKKLVAKYFSYLFISGCIAILIFCMLCYIIDPLQLFHKSWFMPKDMLSADMREQGAGIIKNYDFDSAILGTSMLENTSAEEASRKLGGKFFNLSLSGSNFPEREAPLKLLLKKHPKKIIYSMDMFSYLDLGKDDTFPYLLYDDNPFNDFSFYATKKNFMNLFSSDKGLVKVNLDHPAAWYVQPYHAEMFGGIDRWVDHVTSISMGNFLLKELPDLANKMKDFKLNPVENNDNFIKSKKYIDKYLIKYIKENPKTEFYLVFPPYFRFYYTKMLANEPEKFFRYQKIIRYLVELSKHLPNMKLYGFENYDFLDDVANYKDTQHYSHNYNSFIIDSIKNGKNLTPDNVEDYLDMSLGKAMNFPVIELDNEVKYLLEKSGYKSK